MTQRAGVEGAFPHPHRHGLRFSANRKPLTRTAVRRQDWSRHAPRSGEIHYRTSSQGTEPLVSASAGPAAMKTPHSERSIHEYLLQVVDATKVALGRQ